MQPGIIISLIGCFVALAGWLSGRDKKIMSDSEWKGSVNRALDNILNAAVTTGAGLDKLEEKVNTLSERIAVCEEALRKSD